MRIISVPIVQDDVDEGALETFTMALLDPVNATLGDGTAIGTITDDDEPPADDHGDTHATATSIAQGSPISGRLETAADVDYFRVTATSDGRLFTATDSGKVGDAGYPAGTVVRIETSTYTSTNDDDYDVADLDLDSALSAEAYVRVSGVSATRYEVAVWFTAPTELDWSYDIDLRFLGTEPTATQRSAIRAAADVWERVIAAGQPFLIVIDSDVGCDAADPSAFGDYIDDIRIDIRLKRLDGAQGALAAATPCRRRSGGLPVISEVTFDTGDLPRIGDTGLRRVAVHEIAHALGFGVSVQWNGLRRDSARTYLRDHPRGTMPPDTYFAGSSAVHAFDELLDGDTYDGNKVPLENDTSRYEAGGLDSHWRESVFGNELLTASISTHPATSQPLSKVTIAALGDLGYSVDLTAADSYTLPSRSRRGSKAARAVADEIHLGDDVRPGPIVVAELPDQPIPVISP